MSLALLLGSLGGGGEGITQGDIWHGGDSSLYALTVAADLPILWYRMHALNGQIEPDLGSLNQPAIYYNNPTLNQVGALTDDPAVLFSAATFQTLTGVDNDSYSIGTTGQFTVEWWAKASTDAVAIVERMVGKVQVAPDWEWVGERYPTGEYAFRVFNNGGGPPPLAHSTFGIPTLNEYHHFVATISTSGGTCTLKTYLDADLLDTQTFSAASVLSGSAPLQVGAAGSDFGFNGLIDEVAIYSTTLSQTRILAHYSARDPGSTPPPTEVGSSTSSILFDVIFARHPASVLGTGNNPDLIVNGREAV